MRQSSSIKYRVGIIGAGTAGLATAIVFVRSGHRVQVFEKHSALAAIDAGLLIQPQHVRALSDLGVRDEFDAASVPIDRVLGKNHRDSRLVDIA